MRYLPKGHRKTDPRKISGTWQMGCVVTSENMNTRHNAAMMGLV